VSIAGHDVGAMTGLGNSHLAITASPVPLTLILSAAA
jgi:hypothetical protein